MASAPTPPVEVWHEHYNYPSGDLILVSNDGVKFRTFGELIARSSGALEAMDTSTLVSETGGPDATMIRLDYQATIIVQFLDAVSVSDPALFTSFDDTVSLLALAEKFQAQKLIPYTIQYLQNSAETNNRADDLLLLTSARDDWVMGRSALAKLWHVKSIASKPGGLEGYFAKLRPTWRQRLIELVFTETYEKKKLVYDWSLLAHKFISPPPHPASPVPVSAAEKRKSAEEPDAAQKRVKTENADGE